MQNMIRRAEIKDIPHIMKLLLQVNMVHHTGRPDIFKGNTTKFDEKELEAIIADDNRPIFVCVDEDDIPCGHAFCEHESVKNNRLFEDMESIYIHDICVDESVRGNKVGKKLYDYVVQYAKEHGCNKITLNVWECNPGAKKFYENMGLKPQKTVMEYLLDE